MPNGSSPSRSRAYSPPMACSSSAMFLVLLLSLRAASRISDTGGTLVPNESESRSRRVESARFPNTQSCASCGGGSKRRVVRRQIRFAFVARINTRS